MSDLQNRLKITPDKLDSINDILLNPDMEVVKDFLKVVEKYGTPEEINAKADQARDMDNLRDQVKKKAHKYLDDLDWLQEKREQDAFISVDDYRKKVLGDKAGSTKFADDFAVTLEVSACQYFPWVIETVKRAKEQGSLVPSRFIRVRNMKEQEKDGDLPAFAAFDVLRREEGRQVLWDYYKTYVRLARDRRVGFILESPTWRASRDWGQQIGYDAEALKEINQQSVALLADIRQRYETDDSPMVISGCSTSPWPWPPSLSS